MWKVALVLGVICPALGTITKLMEYGCFYYNAVDDVKGIIHVDCDQKQVFDPKTITCITPTAANWPCKDVKDCSKLANHRYVDKNIDDPQKKCKSYYTCQNGYFYGHNYCPGPTVYNEKMQYCDWVTNVEPPCGTKVPDPAVG